MAQKHQIILIDDIDGSEADETVTFGLDGVDYEIDLTAEHAEELRETIASWVEHGRRTGGRAKRRGGRPDPSVDTAAVREWARKEGYEVSDRGRIPAQIVDAYKAR